MQIHLLELRVKCGNVLCKTGYLWVILFITEDHIWCSALLMLPVESLIKFLVMVVLIMKSGPVEALQ